MIAIFDIDGTLSDNSKRVHFVNGSSGPKKDWDSFHDRAGEDDPYHNIVKLAQHMHFSGVNVVLCTGRPETHRQVTEDWLLAHGVPYDDLLMRPAKDHRPDVALKKELVEHIDREDILFIIEDRDRVVRMWREEGITCLQCKEGEY